MKHKATSYLSAFIMGGLTGGAIALLSTPYRGKEFRERLSSNADNYLGKAKRKEEEIINKAKITADGLLTKTIQVSALIEKYAWGVGEESRWRIANEIICLRAALKAASETYRNGSAYSPKAKSVGEWEEDIFADYDSVILPRK